MKMNNKAHHGATYPFRNGEHILIDTNIWLYLHPPATKPASSWEVTRYSNVFARLLRAKAQPVVDALILSEYLNSYIRIEYAAWKSTYPKFKDFRNSADAVAILRSAVAEVGQILNTAVPHDTALTNIDLPAVLGAVQSAVLDFNDGLLIENCRKHGWKLLTNDADMQLGGIDLITHNKRLLTACP